MLTNLLLLFNDLRCTDDWYGLSWWLLMIGRGIVQHVVATEVNLIWIELAEWFSYLLTLNLVWETM